MLTDYQIIYMTTGLFGVYTIYRFMRLFYESRISSKLLEIISYNIYFLLITVIYFTANIPLVLAITNITAFICLSFNYKASIKKRLMSSIYIFLILMSIELIVGVLSGCFGVSMFKNNEFENSFLLILVRVLSYMTVLLLGNLKNIKRGNEISKSNWLSVIIIPITSLYLIVLVFQSTVLFTTQVAVAITILLLINVLVFYLYDTLQLHAEKEIERKLLLQQNKYYNNQFQLMHSSEEAMKAARHDWKNHLAVLSSLIEKKENTKANTYLQEILKSEKTRYRYVNTGNTDFDSILNFKLREASKIGIDFNLEISIPEKLEINAFDLTTILGNVLDNAIEAAEKADESSFISIDISYNRGRLIIKINNSFNSKVTFVEGVPITTKLDKKNHGIGLKQIEKTLEKYNGDMDITIDHNVFKIFILIYVEQK